MTKLNYKSVPSRSSMDKSMVIFLHGYGANGADLLSIGDMISEHLPDTVFLAPDAPDKCNASPFGFQWFPIPWIDGSSEADSKFRLEESLEKLSLWIDHCLLNKNISVAKTCLFGFSQGTMMSLELAPRRTEPFGGVIGFSGRLVSNKISRKRVKSRCPILLIHGEQDEVIEPHFLNETVKELKANEFQVESFLSPNVGHGIGPDGLNMALDFLKRTLY